MFLQTYLYNYCATLANALTDEPLPLLLYGVERVKYLCEEWARFLAPSMFNSFQNTLKDSQLEAWSEVMCTADQLSVLSSHCDDLLTYAPKGTYGGSYRRFGTIQYLLSKQVVPWLYNLKYHSEDCGRAVCFGSTQKVITSFVPFSTVSDAHTVPAVYNANERAVVQLYLSVLRNAPSIVLASGSSDEDASLNLLWLARGEWPSSYAETPIESRMITGAGHSPFLYKEILQVWEQEMSQCAALKD